MGGAFGYVQGSGNEFKNVNVNKVNINCTKKCNRYSSSTGGFAANLNKSVLSNCTISNVNLISEMKLVGGFVGYCNGYANTDVCFQDCNILNTNIKGIEELQEACKNCKHNIGGIVGFYNGNNGFKNIKLDGVNIEGNVNQVGGICGTSYEKKTFENIEVNNSNIINKNGNAAGICCILSYQSTLNNVKVTNSTIKGEDIVGGVVGIGNVEIDNAIVDNCNISNNTSSLQGCGGIIGMLHKTQTFSDFRGSVLNSTVKNTVIKSNGYTGGIAGFGIGTISGNTVLNTSVTSTGNDEVGGIVGFISDASSRLNQNTVNNSIIIGNSHTGGIVGYLEGNLQDNIVNNNSKITTTNNDSSVGGIVGMASNSSTEIDDCNVNEITITGQNGYTGGIAGFSNNTITNCNVSDSNILSKGASAYGLGGIVGHGSNVLEDGLTVIRNCSVEKCELTGKDAVGGIAGSSVPEITNCVVNGNLVNSLSLLDDIAGNQDLQDLETTDNAGLTGFSLMSYFVSDEQNQVVDSVIDVSDEEGVLDETEGDEEQQNDNGLENEDSIENNDEGLDDNAQDELSDDKIQDELGNEEQDDDDLNDDDLNDDELDDIEADVSESDNDDIDVKEGIKKFEDVVDNVLIGFSNNINKFISRIFRVKDDKTIIKGQSVVLAENGTEEVSEDDYGVKIKGNRFVGGIIGNSGELSSDDYSSVKITNCLVNNTYIRGSADVDYTIGKRLTFSEGYSGCASNLEDSVDELTEWLESIFEVK